MRFKPQAILFDNDGVLVDSEVIHVQCERELLGEIGLDYAYEDYMSRFVGMPTPAFLKALAVDHEARLGTPFPEDFHARLKARVWPRIDAELEALPGVADLLDQFDGPFAVASSAHLFRLRHKLTLTGMLDWFEPHIYSADMVEHGKPAPDLFLHASAALGIDPEQCLVIEDSVNGVRAGRAAGMQVIGFTGGGHADAGLAARLSAAGAHAVVAGHNEIGALLRDA
ncbi:MAG: HAD family hydrolase [Pseudomonadota bacterium]